MKEVQMFECAYCYEPFRNERDALQCEFRDVRCSYANRLFKDGWNLRQIKCECGFHWTLSPEQEEITTESCFVISWWQCCNKPAYKITEITKQGGFELFGRGGWRGGYRSTVSDVSKLGKPHPKEELFVY